MATHPWIQGCLHSSCVLIQNPSYFKNIAMRTDSVTAVVKAADDVRGHSTDSLIHKDHVDVVTVALILFVALIHG